MWVCGDGGEVWGVPLFWGGKDGTGVSEMEIVGWVTGWEKGGEFVEGRIRVVKGVERR